jgi:hypothetical protein
MTTAAGRVVHNSRSLRDPPGGAVDAKVQQRRGKARPGVQAFR